MVERSSDMSPAADPGIWQFSLRQCLVTIALVAGVCGVYRFEPILGWFAGVSLTVPAVLFLPVRGIFIHGLLIGAFMGGVTAAALINWSGPGPADPALIAAALSIPASIGAILGASVNLIKKGYIGWGGAMLIFLVFGSVWLITLLLPPIRS